jgi:hypothetical protein
MKLARISFLLLEKIVKSRGSVLDCGSPLPLSDMEKRQRTCSLQNLAENLAAPVSIRVHSWLKIFSLLFTISFSLSACAVEPWADKNLSVTNGLELWLDASKEIIARKPGEKKGPLNRAASKLIHGGPLDLWHDASGNKRDLFQPVPSARPKFFRTTSGAFVRFDGVDDFVAATGLEQEFGESTVFILAAPRTNQSNFSAFLSFNRAGENDFLTGLNIDLGNGAKKKFDFLNVEGPGFVGLKNVMTSAAPFGEPHVISVMAEAGTNDFARGSMASLR